MTYAYQWLAHDGTDDAEIENATGATHEVAPAQVGKTLKVRVTFTDEGGTEEVLTSVATEAVAARAPDAPGGLAAATAVGREGELDVTWTAPASDGGSEVTGYKVQWKSGTESYDGSASSTRQAVVSDPAVLTHTITELTVGTAYTVRVMAVNVAGDGAAAEVAATAEDRVAPVLAASSVNGTALALTFSEALDAGSKPAADAFAVSVAGDARTVDAVALSGSAVTLTLASAVASDDTVTVGYTAPTGANATPLKDAAGNAAAGFTGQAVTNDTPAANTTPTGLPEVSGTPQVGEVLTASVDGITDEDGLDNVTYAYQWLANNGTDDTEIAGATKASYTVAAEQVGKTLKVRVTFTDDKGTAETLVSAATDAVTVPPLTATFENVPSEHDGSSIFTFRVRFSESPALSYTVLRDESFAVTGGSVDKARRVDGRNDLREIHVEPAGNGDVTLTLAGGRACGTTGAICTADNRVLSSTLTATVQGPPALNVADSRAEEGEDATLDFVVTLSRAAAGTVSVDYATADGSATAGEDYTATNGTLTFNAGETTETVSVPLLDDVVNDGGETFTLTLSNPSGAWIEDGEAVGTIENNDPLPTAWTARFGRSVAGHVLDAVEGRLEGGASGVVPATRRPPAGRPSGGGGRRPGRHREDGAAHGGRRPRHGPGAERARRGRAAPNPQGPAAGQRFPPGCRRRRGRGHRAASERLGPGGHQRLRRPRRQPVPERPGDHRHPGGRRGVEALADRAGAGLQRGRRLFHLESVGGWRRRPGQHADECPPVRRLQPQRTGQGVGHGGLGQRRVQPQRAAHLRHRPGDDHGGGRHSRDAAGGLAGDRHRVHAQPRVRAGRGATAGCGANVAAGGARRRPVGGHGHRGDRGHGGDACRQQPGAPDAARLAPHQPGGGRRADAIVADRCAARRRRRRDGQRPGGGFRPVVRHGVGPERGGVGARPAGARGR